jgi:hypothetical protein
MAGCKGEQWKQLPPSGSWKKGRFQVTDNRVRDLGAVRLFDGRWAAPFRDASRLRLPEVRKGHASQVEFQGDSNDTKALWIYLLWTAVGLWMSTKTLAGLDVFRNMKLRMPLQEVF